MQAKLVVVEPHSQPDEYVVTLPTTIGRGGEATLKLSHALVSRQHCQLFAEQGRIMVRDLGSMNGTFVGGQRVEIAPLSSGELLTVGKVTLRIVYGDNVIMSGQNPLVSSVDTISMEDTVRGSHRPDEDEELGQLFDDEDDPQNFFRNMN